MDFVTKLELWVKVGLLIQVDFLSFAKTHFFLLKQEIRVKIEFLIKVKILIKVEICVKSNFW